MFDAQSNIHPALYGEVEARTELLLDALTARVGGWMRLVLGDSDLVLEGLRSRPDHDGMLREPQVVVRRERDDRAPVDDAGGPDRVEVAHGAAPSRSVDGVEP